MFKAFSLEDYYRLRSATTATTVLLFIVLTAAFLTAAAQTSDAQTTGDDPAVGRQLLPELGDAVPSGFSGGITSNDFQPLMDLIQSVIKSDSWQDNGGEGAIIDYPAGVYADAASAVVSAGNGHTLDERLNFRLAEDSQLRTISLNRIEDAISAAVAANRAPSEDLKNLAGIYRVEYVFIDAEHNDILIAGPAGPWKTDTSGRAVNVNSRCPTLKLDDLVSCLINAFEDDGKFGCTIVPKPDALAAAHRFIENNSSVSAGRKWRESLRSAVGKQNIIVHGVSPDSGIAQTIVEADCLMKKIGMGLEPSIDEVPNYFDRVKDDPTSANAQTLVRWWFTMASDALKKDDSNRIFHISGNSVKVLSENELLDRRGRRIHTGVADDATAGFAADFSFHFKNLSKKHPVLASLRNVFDLALVANIIRTYDVRNFDRWNDRYRRADEASRINRERTWYVSTTHAYADEIDSIMNFETFYYRDRGKRFRRTIVGVTGGVEFNFARVKSKIEIDQRSRSKLPRVLTGGLPDHVAADPSIWWWN